MAQSDGQSDRDRSDYCWRHTVSFSEKNEHQRAALDVYYDLLPHTESTSVGALLTRVLVVFAKQAANHPGINIELAQSITAEEFQEFLEWKRQNKH